MGLRNDFRAWCKWSLPWVAVVGLLSLISWLQVRDL